MNKFTVMCVNVRQNANAWGWLDANAFLGNFEFFFWEFRIFFWGISKSLFGEFRNLFGNLANCVSICEICDGIASEIPLIAKGQSGKNMDQKRDQIGL